MGEVWLATAHGASGFSKRVVLKTILPELARNPAYVDMLINEASLAARLNHPNIVQVFDLECVGGDYFIAMEYLPGRTLNQMLRRLDEIGERIPVWLALMVVSTVCDALQYAHDYADDSGRSMGLLHRDISPSNVMLTFTGKVTVLDFGIAKASTTGENTASGALKGKFHYMPPERIRGDGADRRSDVYSLGVVLYQLLTWRRPFHADNDAALLDRVLRGKPKAPRKHAPWISRRLERCVLRAIARRPEDRFQQAEELGRELRAQLRDSGEVHEPADIARYLRQLFPEPPELQTITSTANGLPLAAESSPSIDIETGSFEVLEVEVLPVDDALELREEGGSQASWPGEPRSEVEIATGSDRPRMPEESPSVYDVAAARRRWPRETIDIFAPPSRRIGEETSTLFGAAPVLRDEPAAAEAPADSPFTSSRSRSAERWPWAATLKKPTD